MTDELDDILKGAARENLQRMGISERSQTSLASNMSAVPSDLPRRMQLSIDGFARGESISTWINNELLKEAKAEIERLTRERGQWKERHDRERAAHAANLTQQRKVEAERDRLRAIESRLDAAICLHLPVDPNGPGDCTDRLVAAVELAAQTMRANGVLIKELDEERERLARERDGLLAAVGEHVTVRSDQYAEIMRLRVTLQWYADNLGASKSRDMRIITQDGGERARKALAGAARSL